MFSEHNTDHPACYCKLNEQEIRAAIAINYERFASVPCLTLMQAVRAIRRATGWNEWRTLTNLQAMGFFRLRLGDPIVDNSPVPYKVVRHLAGLSA